jgi:hypothetical protein
LNEHQTAFEDPAGDETPAATPDHSLRDDVRAVIEDGKTYLEAELQFQKSRAAFVADRSRSGAIYAVGALLLLHLALITLAIGLVFALSRVFGPWGATGIVVGVLVIGGVVLGLAAKRRFTGMTTALGGANR